MATYSSQSINILLNSERTKNNFYSVRNVSVMFSAVHVKFTALVFELITALLPELTTTVGVLNIC